MPVLMTQLEAMEVKISLEVHSRASVMGQEEESISLTSYRRWAVWEVWEEEEEATLSSACLQEVCPAWVEWAAEEAEEVQVANNSSTSDSNNSIFALITIYKVALIQKVRIALYNYSCFEQF
jgi:hypothetical protein